MNKNSQYERIGLSIFSRVNENNFLYTLLNWTQLKVLNTLQNSEPSTKASRS